MSKERKRLYIAYGSNLNLEQMARRCPTAKVVGTATMYNWELLFRGSCGGAVATVEKSNGNSVPVLVWRLQSRDEAALDIYEGYPNLYRKETVRIKLKGKPVSAMIYIMNSGYPCNCPSVSYLSTIREGYIRAGFGISSLYGAAFKSSKEGDCNDRYRS